MSPRRRHVPIAGLLAVAVVVAAGCGTATDVEMPLGAPPTVSSVPTGDLLLAPADVVDATGSAPTQVSTTIPLGPDPDAGPSSADPAVDDAATAATAGVSTTAAPTTVASTTVAPASTGSPLAAEQVVDPVASTVAPSTTAAPTGWAAFDQHLTESILAPGSQAVSATVLRDGEIVHRMALGDRTAGGDEVEVTDRFRVASISKVVTSIAVLRLAQAQVLDLDAPVGERLAAVVGVAPNEAVRRITTRDLLAHRSGIAQYEKLMFDRRVESCRQAGAAALGAPLEREPGTTYRYSNVNFCLLGLLVENVTGLPYEEFVRAELLRPLGIDEGMRLAGTFDVRDGDVEHDSKAGRNYMETLDAAGSWIASPTDIARIIDSLDPSTPGYAPLGPGALAQMTTITVDPPAPPAAAPADGSAPTTTVDPGPPTKGYGLGLIVFGPGSYGHTGTLESTHAMTVRRPDGITWTVLVSGDHPSSSRSLAGIVDEALRLAGEA